MNALIRIFKKRVGVAGKLIINDSDLAVEKCHMLFFYYANDGCCAHEAGEGRLPPPSLQRWG